MSGFRFSTRTLTTLAMLTALEIVLSRFLSLNAWNIKIGFNGYNSQRTAKYPSGQPNSVIACGPR